MGKLISLPSENEGCLLFLLALGAANAGRCPASTRPDRRSRVPGRVPGWGTLRRRCGERREGPV